MISNFKPGNAEEHGERRTENQAASDKKQSYAGGAGKPLRAYEGVSFPAGE